MTVRRPLVRVGGRTKQLPVGDTVAGTDGLSVGDVLPWKLSEGSIPAGRIANNGQLLSRATWPQLWALVAPFAVTDAVWLAAPYDQRGKFSSGDGSTTFRMPDDNAKHADGNTLGGMVLRGYGKNSTGDPGAHQADQLGPMLYQDSTTTAAANVFIGNAASGTSQATLPRNNITTATTPVSAAPNGSKWITNTGNETRMVNSTIIWVTVGASTASNPGSVDVTALATEVSTQSSRIAATETGKQGKPYVSSQQDVVAGGTFNVFHGLAVKPSDATFSLICSTADAGFAVGDELYGVGYYSTLSAANNRGLSVSNSDATSVQVRFGSAATTFAALHKTTGVLTGLTNTSWKIVMKVWP